jgi:hypothetical protein
MNCAIVQGVPQQCEWDQRGNNIRIVRLGRRRRRKQQKEKLGKRAKGNDENVEERYNDKKRGGGW